MLAKAKKLKELNKKLGLLTQKSWRFKNKRKNLTTSEITNFIIFTSMKQTYNPVNASGSI